jgi:hypothetical protein
MHAVQQYTQHLFYARLFYAFPIANLHHFLGAFAKLRKAAISSIMYVCMYVCLSVRMEHLGSHWTDFLES